MSNKTKLSQLQNEYHLSDVDIRIVRDCFLSIYVNESWKSEGEVWHKVEQRCSALLQRSKLKYLESVKNSKNNSNK